MDPGSSLTIVALPKDDDITWRLSSEKAPHMTILFLGDQSKNPKLGAIQDYVEHAASQLSTFDCSVTRRGPLGDHNADVLFFEGNQMDNLRDFRSNLLANDDIKTAYDSVEQFPGWTPHLTMGYPDAPAKKDTRDYPGVNWVCFDRIAVWTGDSEGPTFPLKNYRGEVSLSMSDQLVEDVLAHFGVLGMHWGVRKSDSGGSSGPEAVVVSKKRFGNGLKATGGKGHGPHNEAINATAAARKAQKSGLASLSNTELQSLVSRMNLEQQFVRLKETEPTAFYQGQLKVKKVLKLGKTAQEVHQFANSPLGKDIQKLFIRP